MIKRKMIIYIVIFAITIIQICLYFNEDNKTTEVISSNEVRVKGNFKEIDIELNEIENLEVLELKDDGEIWSGKVLLSGSKEEVLNSIELLKNYNIINYKIDGNVNDFQVLLDICRWNN